MLPIACCLLPIHLGPSLKLGQCWSRAHHLGWKRVVDVALKFMRHGHEMLWFSRGSFSERVFPLSYNAKVQNTRIQLIGYEINLLNKV